MTPPQEDRNQFIKGLFAVAEFYEKYPDAHYDGMNVSLNMYVTGRKARSVLAAMAGIFGEHEELCDEKYVAVAKRFGKKVKLELFAPRSAVCRGVVVGTRVEPALVIQATDEFRISERVVDIVEWRCPRQLGKIDA